MALGLTQASYDFMFTGFEIGRNFIGLDFKNLGSELIFFCTQLGKEQRMKVKKKKDQQKKPPSLSFSQYFLFFLALWSFK